VGEGLPDADAIESAVAVASEPALADADAKALAPVVGAGMPLQTFCWLESVRGCFCWLHGEHA
jgi:hypothetical protein